MLQEQQNPWVKRLFVGFARTSEFNGPSKPDGPPHHLIQEIDSELPASQPALQLTHKIFGSCPPMRSFDPAKLLTVWLSFLIFCLSATFFVLFLTALWQHYDYAGTVYGIQDSGKLQTLDILLKRLRAENHRVLLFAQMTKMLNILEVSVIL